MGVDAAAQWRPRPAPGRASASLSWIARDRELRDGPSGYDVSASPTTVRPLARSVAAT